ncbi:MAG: serine/threonine-protein kinase [Myxococcota bacterium]
MAKDPFDSVKAEDLIGKTLDGRYRIDAVLGQGGMGMVFRGVQTSMQRPVALKTLHPQLAMAPSFFERFRREAEIASRLHHPNIITIFDFGQTPDGMCYYVMELLEGESLRQRVKQHGPMTLREAAAVIEQTALGVGHAHKQNVIHRDIKPHNVMLTQVDGNEYVKVLDFGLVKALESEDEEHLTSTGQVLGTPQYMPPEQAGGEVVDQRSDLYSLTGVLFYCLTGHSPYGANSVRKALTASLSGKVPPVSTYRQGAPVPEAIDRFIAKGLKPEKEDRFQTADEFIKALLAATAGVPDAVLDAAPIFTPDTSKESGSGSSSASRKGSQSKSRPASRSVSAVSKPIPKSASSKVEVSPSAAAETPRPRPKSGGLGLLVGFAAVLVVGIGGAVAWKMSAKPAEPPPSKLVTSPTKPGTDAPRPPPVTPTPAPKVTLTLKTKPAGAEVLEGGVVIGKTPLTAAFDQGTTRTLTFRLAEYRDLEKSLRPESDQELEFHLERVAPRATTTKKPPKKPDDDIGAFE